ncbi:TadE family protein [Paenibacillus caui]|uniref:TadE family protein n=1 Tax=Paenibacillus caui TaxID=2873927 RepID=UPI003080175F
MLEASLVLPLFIMFVFFFIYMVQMTLLSTRMHAAASNAVKQVSAHIYPIFLAVQAADKKQDDPFIQADDGERQTENGTFPSISIKDWADAYASKLPSPFSDWIMAAAEKGQEPIDQLKTETAEAVLDPVMKPILEPFLDEAGLELERVHVTRVIVPDLKTGKTPYFGIEISYELPIRVPFTYKKVVIQSKSVERLWIGDTDELNASDGADEDSGQIVNPVVLEKPNPAYAGRRAVIKAKISPGGSAVLTVYYKSGKSIAKYLGTATADENGIIEWEWLVGGNTTPGNWQFVIETPEGGKTVSTFTVESPNSGD